MRRIAGVAVALALAGACRADHGPPRVKRLPKRDDTPALRGGGAPRSRRIASYTIDARLDGVRHTVTATQTLAWTNTGSSPVDTLPLHLYLNAFKNEQSQFMRTSGGSMRGATASETGWGWIQLDSVKVAGVELAGTITYPHAPDETVAILALPQPLAPESTLELQLAFTAQLPEVFARTGYKGDFHLVSQWFPKAGVRVGPPGQETWHCEPHRAMSEFFADFGTYDVSITVPNTHVVAATGVLQSASEAPGQTRTFTYHAEDVHDFAWMADPYMVVDRSGKTPFVGKARVEDGEVEVRVYARKDQAEFAARHLQAAIGAVERYSAYFVPYPWPIMTIVDPPPDASGAAGMEYPTLVTTGGDSVFAPPGIRIPEYTTVHEVGHNWFQGLLASNEVEEPWLDEGVNEWAGRHVMRDLSGARANLIDWMGWQGDIGALAAATADAPGSVPGPVASPAYASVDDEAYGTATYTTAARALTTLEAHVGTAKFLAAMKAYARQFAFAHPTASDLQATLERELGQELDWAFDPMFRKVGGIALSLRDVRCEPSHPPRGVIGEGSARRTVTETEAPDTGTFACTVVIQNTGTVHVPVDVEVEFVDRSTLRLRWDDRGETAWHRFELARSSPIARVRIDPDRAIALADPTVLHRRVHGDGSASLRAAARVASWAQLLMHLVGP